LKKISQEMFPVLKNYEDGEKFQEDRNPNGELIMEL
jgi:hypothetical protein